MHQDVLKLGPELYQKQEEYNLKRFEAVCKTHGEKVTSEFNKEVEKILSDIRDANKKRYAEKEEELHSTVNKFLSAEAVAVRKKKWLHEQSLHRRIDFEGQKRLSDSLNKAKNDFYIEKREALEAKMKELDITAAKNEANKRLEYQKTVDDAQLYWTRKFQDLQEDLRRKREAELQKIAVQIDILNKQLNNELENILSMKFEKLNLEIDFLKRKISRENEKNDILKGNILGLETKKKSLVLNEATVMKAFTQFVCTSKRMNDHEARKVVEAFTHRTQAAKKKNDQ